ncbi:MAG: HEAT repeat domain-containing protein [Rikenellaceae bacterium]|nr:HEAT repeat domain-containing protein [Rikenellaceae bacterium]
MKYTTKIFLVALMTVITVSMSARPVPRSFAIVVDKITYENCRTSIDNYSQAVKLEGLNTFIIIDRWDCPDSIRTELKKLYDAQNLEGAVMIGDIPVPMIRDAQHLTTAFKMDQKRAWDQSSIPSDRFYDDFNLKFEYLKRDTTNKLYFYYNLKPDGPQLINCDIYSARIKAPIVQGKTKYQLISEYLEKVVREKNTQRSLGAITYFAGHGYNSDCMVARADERLSLTEQFPYLLKADGKLNYIDYTYDNYVKYRLMAELAREEVGLAILHHHGSEDRQYFNGSPITSNTSEWLELAKKFFRGKIRNADDTTASKNYYMKEYGVPESWVNNAFDPKIREKDSLSDEAIDTSLPDMKGYVSNARMIIFDACYNGSFHMDDYISGHYIFNPGRTMVVKGNSVNTLQDTWTNQLMGLLDLGVSAGNWAKGQMTLESHLIGDPTYHFTSSRPDLKNINEAIVNEKSNEKFWRKAMKDSNADYKALAMKMLYQAGKITTDELLQIQKEETRGVVRLEAFTLINKSYDKNLIPSIKLGLLDSYELQRRMAAISASNSLSPDLLELIVSIYVQPGVSKRVEFQLKSVLENYPEKEALEALDKALSGKDYEWYKGRMEDKKRFEYTYERRANEYKQLMDPSAKVKEKKFTISALRNSTCTANLDILFQFFKESKENDLKVQLAEAFGWYTQSWKRDEIIKFCQEQSKVETNEQVKNELIRTINRLTN